MHLGSGNLLLVLVERELQSASELPFLCPSFSQLRFPVHTRLHLRAVLHLLGTRTKIDRVAMPTFLCLLILKSVWRAQTHVASRTSYLQIKETTADEVWSSYLCANKNIAELQLHTYVHIAVSLPSTWRVEVIV